MGFGKHKDRNSAELLHRIDLYDFATGEPALHNGIRQHFIVKGGKSNAYKNALEEEAAYSARTGKNAERFSFAKQQKVLANRLTRLIVSAYIDVGDEGVVDLIEFKDINELEPQERNEMQSRLRTALSEITDLALLINEEVVNNANFLPGRGKSLSDLLSSKSTTEQPRTAPSSPG